VESAERPVRWSGEGDDREEVTAVEKCRTAVIVAAFVLVGSLIPAAASDAAVVRANSP